ncbi:CPXCG motif-containing cysteine-rich protein [Aliidiomarina iranensis]|uniref:CPXCG motif-containing cysteine-rich protein n=1 Tax=Aliidiomarina iranensis TaxID=1434071 RepID=A0A432VWM9_9GAMM|nr:CPXCG motif-containing cysteine-rich protein [Aliidiomarina iranensis]RUO20904.1 CPXCG motif-containing cysteine-rich protein [Aliidiomarina iranensis]
MSLSYESEFSCPYCMAPNALEIDAANDVGQAQIVDCQICCQPIELTVHETMEGVFEVHARTDDE